jgi:putative thioredoxin
MSDFMNRASLAGAVDLSNLRNKATEQAGQSTAAAGSSATNSASTGHAPVTIKVASLILEANEANLQNYLTASNSLPIVVEFYAAFSDDSKLLSEKLAAETVTRNGTILLVRVDVETQGSIASAFQVEGAPAVVALIKGQPVPLFVGDQPAEAIGKVFDRIIEVASENGITGRAAVGEGGAGGSSEIAPNLSPRHQAAYDAIDRGDYAGAVLEYEAALNESPADNLAKAGLAQAKLLLRTASLDIDAVITSTPASVIESMRKADVLVAIGHSDRGFNVLLDQFEVADKDEKDVLRKHLLELFDVAGGDAPEVAAARRRLTLLLY